MSFRTSFNTPFRKFSQKLSYFIAPLMYICTLYTIYACSLFFSLNTHICLWFYILFFLFSLFFLPFPFLFWFLIWGGGVLSFLAYKPIHYGVILFIGQIPWDGRGHGYRSGSRWGRRPQRGPRQPRRRRPNHRQWKQQRGWRLVKYLVEPVCFYWGAS